MKANLLCIPVNTLLACLLVGCQAPLRSGGSQFSGYTKTALVRRLGLPAEIRLFVRGAPERELWFYYWKDRSGEIQVADFQFHSGRVAGFSYDFEPSRVLHTESNDDFDLIYERKIDLERTTPRP